MGRFWPGMNGGKIRPAASMIPLHGERRRYASNGAGFILSPLSPDFWAPLNDLGDGQVDIELARGIGSGTFGRASVATCRLSSGLLKKVIAGIPRSHYFADGTYAGYFPETNRTNLLVASEIFGGASWGKTNATTSDNTIIAPDGTLTADKIFEDAVANIHDVRQNVVLAADTSHTISVFVKAAERTVIRVYADDLGANAAFAKFDASNGTVHTALAIAGTWVPITSSIESWVNGWYRVSISFTTTGAAGGRVVWGLNDELGNHNYSGNPANGFYLWGAQAEAGAFASSYIPTVGATVTRLTDSLNYPGANILTDKGTAYLEGMLNPTTTSPMFLQTGDNTGRVLWVTASGALSTSMYDGTSIPDKLGLSDISVAPRKRASAWGDADMYVTGDGLTPTSAAFDGTMGPCSQLNVGTNNFFGTIRNVKIWQRKLTQEDLQFLTGV